MTGSAWLVGRRGQALAVAATVLVCLVLWAGVMQPLIGWYDARQETLLEQRALAQRMEALAATLPSLRRSVGAAADPRDKADIMLAGSSDSVASATLQERVQIMATADGATLSSVETLPAETVGAWRRIGLRVSLTVSWPVLIQLLRSLDEATPRMLVDDLHVHSTLLVAHPVVLPLQTSFTLYAFRPDTGAAATHP